MFCLFFTDLCLKAFFKLFFHGNALFLQEHLYPLALMLHKVSYCGCTYLSLFKTGNLSSPFCNTNKGYCTVLPCAQHVGTYAICPLPFQFLSATFWNEVLGDYEIFKMLLLQLLQRLSFLVFLPNTTSQPLYNLSVFAVLEMGKFLLSAPLAVLLSLEQGGLRTFSCKATCSGSPRGCIQSQRWHSLGQMFWHHSLFRQKPPTGGLGLEIWGMFFEEVYTKRILLWPVASIFLRDLRNLSGPRWSYRVSSLSWLYLLASYYSEMVFFSHRAYWLFVFMILNTCQTLLQVSLATLPPCVLYCLISAQQQCHCPLDTYSLPMSQGLVSLAPHVLPNRLHPSGWRSPLGWPGWAGLGLQGSRSLVSVLDFQAVQNTRLTNLTANAYVSRWWWVVQLPCAALKIGMLGGLLFSFGRW